jgi:hypothetical protein
MGQSTLSIIRPTTALVSKQFTLRYYPTVNETRPKYIKKRKRLLFRKINVQFTYKEIPVAPIMLEAYTCSTKMVYRKLMFCNFWH